MLRKAEDDVHSHFIDYQRFRPRSLFIVTWDEVGYFNQKYDQVGYFNKKYDQVGYFNKKYEQVGNYNKK